MDITTTTTAAVATAAIAGAAAIIKKLLPVKFAPKPEYITRQEFHVAMDDMRDRIDAATSALKDLTSTLEAHRSAFEYRLDIIESAIARKLL